MAKGEFGAEVSPEMIQIVKALQAEVRAQLGPESTFEQRRAEASSLMAKAVGVLLGDLETKSHQDQDTTAKQTPGAELCQSQDRD